MKETRESAAIVSEAGKQPASDLRIWSDGIGWAQILVPTFWNGWLKRWRQLS